MPKLYDLAVVVGGYTAQNGEEKKRWKNIGSIVQTKDGGKVILIDRTFNPAGVPVEPGRDQIMVSLFEPKGEEAIRSDSRTHQHAQSKANGYAPAADLDDEVPF